MASIQAGPFDQADRKPTTPEERHVRVLVTNVEFESKRYLQCRQTIQGSNPSIDAVMEWLSGEEKANEQIGRVAEKKHLTARPVA